MDITSAISGTFGIIFLLVWLLLTAFAFVSILRNANVNGINKMLWLIIVFFIPVIGALIYWIWHGRKKP